MNKNPDISLRDLLIAIFVTIVWGANFSFIKLGLNEIDPFLLTSLRFLFSAIPLVFFLRRPDMNLFVVAVYGLIFGAGMWGIVNIAIHVGISPGLASLVIQFSAFFTVLLSRVVFQEAIRPLQYAGMAVALAGLVLIILNRDGYATLVGTSLVLIGAVSWSVCNLMVKRYKPGDMLAFVVWSSLFSVPPLFLITYLVEGSAPFVALPSNVNLAVVASIVSQSYITTVFGYWVWNSLVKKYSAATIAPLNLLVPVFGVLVSAAIFGEEMNASKVLAAVLIVAGVGIFITSQRLEKLWGRVGRQQIKQPSRD